MNSPTPILRVASNAYYALDRGVWFTASGIAGPWSVAVNVPNAIYAIPASSPLHYVTYVRVYGSTATVVTVGYTPGYYGTVVSDEVVVYGTGYAYSPWVGTYWYGYPGTYGSACAGTYTPWGGWAYSCGVGWAWGVWGGWYAPYYGPYWGGYYGWYGGAVVGAGGGWAAWGPGGWAGTTGNIYRQWGSASTVVALFRRLQRLDRQRLAGAERRGLQLAHRRHRRRPARRRRERLHRQLRLRWPRRRADRQRQRRRRQPGHRRQRRRGRQATAGRVGGYNPATGEGGSAAWVRGEQGGVARVGDDVYGTKDGSVYKRDGAGDWSQVDRSGQWGGVQDRSRTQRLESPVPGTQLRRPALLRPADVAGRRRWPPPLTPAREPARRSRPGGFGQADTG